MGPAGRETTKLSFRVVFGIFTGKHLHKNLYTCMMHKYTVCFKHVGMVKAGTKGHFHTSSLLFSLLDCKSAPAQHPLAIVPGIWWRKRLIYSFFKLSIVFLEVFQQFAGGEEKIVVRHQ